MVVNLLFLLSIVIFIVAVHRVQAWMHRRSDEVKLPRDWWTRFEEQFRSYAAAASEPRPVNEPHGLEDCLED